MYQHVGIVGVGLIGASVGKALKDRGLARRVIGVGRSMASLSRALEIGAIDEAHERLGAELASVELLIVCTPVPLIPDVVERAWTILSPEALITDAGSTKRLVIEEINRRRPEVDRVAEFVGSHPMAGSHRRGPEASHPDLFQNHTCIVIQDGQASDGARDRVMSFWRSLGMNVEEMSAEEHDARVARISHVPHLAAYGLARTTEPEDLKLAGPGFRDTTRLAASPAALWTDIVRENQGPVLTGLDRYLAELTLMRRLIEAGDWAALEKTLSDANHFIERLGNSAGTRST